MKKIGQTIVLFAALAASSLALAASCPCGPNCPCGADCPCSGCQHGHK